MKIQIESTFNPNLIYTLIRKQLLNITQLLV